MWVFFWASAFNFMYYYETILAEVDERNSLPHFLSDYVLIFPIKLILYLLMLWYNLSRTWPLLPKFRSSRSFSPPVKVMQASQHQIRWWTPSTSALLWIIYNLRLRGALAGFSKSALILTPRWRPAVQTWAGTARVRWTTVLFTSS